ncbi:MAG: amino acid ABC transporter substrate-binding protein [Mesorhizobium sp. 61-13]|nr:transporter substrate-binding domain-containing protein [Mesorhizobium sp.]OJU52342.1 MAG: amino acid ABC transporter substrate-binding protein [Mesorhizobium sp. 61-13]
MSQRDPIKVGVLFSDYDAVSASETAQLKGTLFAIQEINEAGGIDGRELVAVQYDPHASAGQYRVLAERLIIKDKVNVIFGCFMSHTRKAVIPVIEKWNRLLFYPTLYEGFEHSNNVIYTGPAPNQNSVQLAEFMTSNFGARIYIVGSDYIFPYESNRIMTDLVQQRQDSEKVGERYVGLDATEKDFTDIIADIKNERPDFIFSTVVGNPTQYLYRAYADAGLDPKEMPIGSLSTSEAEIAQMGADVAAGHFTSAPYFQSIATPTNRICLENFRRRFGDETVPNQTWEAAYFQVYLFANAVRQVGSDEIDVLLPALLGSEHNAPQGRIRIDPSNNHTCLYPRIGQAKADGQFTIVRESRRAVYPDPYLVTHSLGDWTAKLDK